MKGEQLWYRLCHWAQSWASSILTACLPQIHRNVTGLAHGKFSRCFPTEFLYKRLVFPILVTCTVIVSIYILLSEQYQVTWMNHRVRLYVMFTFSYFIRMLRYFPSNSVLRHFIVTYYLTDSIANQLINLLSSQLQQSESKFTQERWRQNSDLLVTTISWVSISAVHLVLCPLPHNSRQSESQESNAVKKCASLSALISLGQ
jgi:hypothetical protein